MRFSISDPPPPRSHVHNPPSRHAQDPVHRRRRKADPKGKKKVEETTKTSCSDTDAGFAPVTSLGVVSIIFQTPLATTILSSQTLSIPLHPSKPNVESSCRKCLPDRIARPQSNPLGNGPILLLGTR